VPPAARERMRHLYGRAASYMDRWLADVLEALDRRGILDETLVVVTSDHGENFGENGLIAHACSLDDRLIRVPFIAAGPGSAFEERVTSLAELPRLLADRAGLPHAPWAREELPQGVALAEHEPVSGPEHPRMREFVERRGIGEEGERRLTMAMTAATDGARKLVRTDRGEELLFHLDADPLEREPRDGSDEALRAALAHPALRAAPPAPEPTSEELGELEQQMRLLGYL
jgi:arylsulfatase A-like enzyme